MTSNWSYFFFKEMFFHKKNVEHYRGSYWHMSTQLTGRAALCSHVSYLSSILFCKYSSAEWVRSSSRKKKSTSQNFPKLHWQLWQPKISFQKGLSSARNKFQLRSVLSADITFCHTLLPALLKTINLLWN